MEIIDTLNFVQSFIWATLLLKRPIGKYTWLGLVFLDLCFIYFIHYFSTVLNISIPVVISSIGIVAIPLLLSYFQINNLSLSLSGKDYISWSILLILSVIFVILCLLYPNDINLHWICVIILGSFTYILDMYALIKRLKRKTYTGSWMNDAQLKLNHIVLLDKTIILVFAYLVIFPIFNQKYFSVINMIFHCLIATLAFITGYYAVTSTFIKKKKIIKRNINNMLVLKINQLMQEQKPYLNCELTLEKMADMLNITANELTIVLNNEMGQSFYKLINDYRIKTAQNKLKEPSNRKFTIMASAYESGFNSKSTFYRIFKEYTNMTPKEYISGFN